MRENFENTLKKYVFNCESSLLNYELALEYFFIGQTASASTFFLRAAERYYLEKNINMSYDSLIMASLCFENQGNREATQKSLVLSALNIDIKRPESYFLMSEFYKKQKKFSESYAFCNICHSTCDFSKEPTLANYIQYLGKYCIIYQKAFSAWNLGKVDECRQLYYELLKDHWNDMSSFYRQKVESDIREFRL